VPPPPPSPPPPVCVAQPSIDATAGAIQCARRLLRPAAADFHPRIGPRQRY